MNELFETLDGILALPSLEPEGVGAVLGVSLARRPSHNRYLRVYGASLDEGPVAGAELRVPGAGATTDERRLVLTPDSGLRIPWDEVADTYGATGIVDVNPDVPPEGIISSEVTAPDGTRALWFQFTARSRELVSVVVVES